MAGQDTIQFGYNNYLDYYVVNNDVVFYGYNNYKLTVKNGKNKKITTIDSDGIKSTLKYTDDSSETLTNKTETPY